jgi:outer membrane protein assembly factor BamB
MKTEDSKDVPRKPRKMRWWMPSVILLIAVATITALNQAPELPIIKKIMFGMLTVVVSALLLLVWFMFLSAFRWRTRFIGLAVIVLLVFGFSRVVRIDGAIDGSGQPRLVWKWTPKNTGLVKAQPVAMLSTSTTARKPEVNVAFPGLLGNSRNGVISGILLDRDWTAHPPQQVWRQPVGLGWAGFAIAGSTAVTLEQRAENELVVAYELTTGNTLWMHTNRVRFSEKMGGDGPRSTPTIANSRVYTVGATGILNCLDLQDGRLIWSHDVLGETHQPNLIFGVSCSPLIVDDLVIVTGGLTNGPTLLAYRIDNGSNIWKSGADNASYSSPMLATLCGKRQVLSVNEASVTAHNPADGRILWKYDWKKWGPRCAQPVIVEGDRVFLSAGFGVGCVLLQIKSDAAGQLSAEELWKNLRLKTQFSTAVARGNFVYGLDEGVLACINLATGERAWKDGHYGYGEVLMIDDMLLVQTEPGAVTLVEADPAQYREVARFGALNSKTWNNPALAGEYFITRNDQEAICYRLPLQKPRSIN